VQDYIVIDPIVLAGKLIIRGTRPALDLPSRVGEAASVEVA